jgi:glucose/arabinose dehydrogenase
MASFSSKRNREGFALTVMLCLIAGPLFGQTPSVPQGDIAIDLELIADGLTAPLYATHAGDNSGRLFVVGQAGTVRIVDESGSLLADPFLDLTSSIAMADPLIDERGLLGLAFHPDFAQNGRFFVRYSAPRPGRPGEPCFATNIGCHEEVLSEFIVSEADPDEADPGSERILFRIDQPQSNHNGGDVAFGPDGILYFALGDGGGSHDGFADSPPSHGPLGNGQNIKSALGSILRIDVDRPPDPGLEYAIPPSNPFRGPIPGVDEIYAFGMRNPYRFSFDDGPGGDGRLWLADVGQNLFEEINIIQKGGNYGWVTTEGFHCFDPLNPTVPPLTCPGSGPRGEPLLNPIAAYSHEDGAAVIGGFVYRGSRFPRLFGKYIFGDFNGSSDPGNGRVFWIDTDGAPSDIFEFDLEAIGGELNRLVLGFGEDQQGELYLLTADTSGPTGNTGKVWHIVDRAELGAKVTICHRGKTISVSRARVFVHQVQGGRLGSCG